MKSYLLKKYAQKYKTREIQTPFYNSNDHAHMILMSLSVIFGSIFIEAFPGSRGPEFLNAQLRLVFGYFILFPL